MSEIFPKTWFMALLKNQIHNLPNFLQQHLYTNPTMVKYLHLISLLKF